VEANKVDKKDKPQGSSTPVGSGTLFRWTLFRQLRLSKC